MIFSLNRKNRNQRSLSNAFMSFANLLFLSSIQLFLLILIYPRSAETLRNDAFALEQTFLLLIFLFFAIHRPEMSKGRYIYQNMGSHRSEERLKINENSNNSNLDR